MKFFLPLYERNIHRFGVDFFAHDGAVFDVNDPVGHLRYGSVVRDDDNRLLVMTADVVQQL